MVYFKAIVHLKILRREIERCWNQHMHDIAYCYSKFKHLYKAFERVIAFTGRATGL